MADCPSSPSYKPATQDDEYNPEEPAIDANCFDFLGDLYQPVNIGDVKRPMVYVERPCIQCKVKLQFEAFVPPFLLRRKGEPVVQDGLPREKQPHFWENVFCRGCQWNFRARIYIPPEFYKYCTLERFPIRGKPDYLRYSNGAYCLVGRPEPFVGDMQAIKRRTQRSGRQRSRSRSRSPRRRSPRRRSRSRGRRSRSRSPRRRSHDRSRYDTYQNPSGTWDYYYQQQPPPPQPQTASQYDSSAYYSYDMTKQVHAPPSSSSSYYYSHVADPSKK